MDTLSSNERDNYTVLSQFYDLEFEPFDADLHMYQQFAKRARGPILELGCGTGRVLPSLLEAGYPVSGVDTSEHMLEAARQRVGDEVELVNRDMRNLNRSPELNNAPFRFALSAINTFLHLPDVQSQLYALESIREVVQPGGILLLDVFLPDPAYLLSLDGRVQHDFQSLLPSGDRLDKWSSRTHDIAAQIIETTVFFDITTPDGELTRLIDSYTTRYIHVYELEHLLHRTGWELVSLYGGYDLEPFDSDAERIIALAARSDGD